jgi:large subunit ribosomal protein L22
MTHLYMPKAVAQKSGKAMLRDAPVSPKVAMEIAAFLRGKDLDAGIRSLERVLQMKEAIPYKRFTNAVGHRPGKMASGRYPQKASGEFLKLLKNAKSNATNAGLTGALVISHIAVNRAAEGFRNRAKFRVQFKRAHLECIVTEAPADKKEKKTRSAPKKTAAKQD